MRLTNPRILLSSLAALGLMAAGCDIFPEQPGGTPAVVRVLAVDQLAYTTPLEVNAADAGGTWNLGGPGIAGVDASNVNPPGPNGHASRFQIIDVQLNKVIDGTTVQKAPDDCTPAANGLTVTTTPAQPATCGDSNLSQISCFTTNWFACYTSESADPSVGSQILVFQLPDGAAYDPTAAPAGQGAGLLPGFTYAVSGTVKDHSGADLAIKASVTTQTAPMVTGVTTNSVTLEWNRTSDVASVDVQRAPDDGTGAPGTFATVAGGAGVIASTLTDNTGAGTEGTPFWYRLVLNPGASAANSGGTNATTQAATVTPTFAAVTATTLTVNWTASAAGVDTYNVQRAPDAAGVAGTYNTLKSGLAATVGTYNDTGLTTATTYWYRIVSVTANGVINKGPGANVTTP